MVKSYCEINGSFPRKTRQLPMSGNSSPPYGTIYSCINKAQDLLLLIFGEGDATSIPLYLDFTLYLEKTLGFWKKFN